jgi:hypothetical protein
LIGGIAGGVVLLITIILVVVLNSGSGSESRQMTKEKTSQGKSEKTKTKPAEPSFEYNEAEKKFLSIVEQINQSNDDYRKAGNDSNAARKAQKLAELERQRELLITNANKTMETLMQPFREQPIKFTVERVYSETAWFGRATGSGNGGDEADVRVPLFTDVLWLECKRGGLTYRFGVCEAENERYEQFRDTIAEFEKGDKVSGTFDLLARRPVKDDIVFATEFRDFRNYGDCIIKPYIKIGLFQRHTFFGTDAEPIIELTPGQGAFGIAPLP